MQLFRRFLSADLLILDVFLLLSSLFFFPGGYWNSKVGWLKGLVGSIFREDEKGTAGFSASPNVYCPIPGGVLFLAFFLLSLFG